MADMFVDAGYSTGVIGKWHLGLGDKAGQQDWNGLVSPNPSDIGFEFSHIMAATADRVPCIWIENGRALGLSPDDPVEVSYTKNFPGEPTGKDNPELLRLHPSHGHDMSIVNGISRIGYMRGGKSALWRDQDIQDSIIANAVRFIEEKSASDKPWFLYLATNDIHVPRNPHERFVGKSGHGLRGDALLSFDWGVGEVMKTLERLGIDENTIVVLSSDNGPVIDDGYKDQAVELLGDHKPAGDLRGGKYSNYEAGTRVPCILRWKNHVKPGVNDLLMSQLDWFASFAAMTGVTLPDGAAPDSENLLDAWLGKSEKGKEYFVTQNIQNFLGITDGEWKFIPRNNAPALNVQTNTELGNSPKDQLFKLNGDRSESVNVIDKNPEVAAKLKKELERIVDNRYLQNMPTHVWVVFFRVPALKIFRAAHRPLEKWQTVDCRLPVHSLSAADPCGHGTDRHKRTEHYHEYTHHFSKGLKLPMGTMVKPSSFTFRLLKSNSSSKELPKLSSTTTIKLCASSPSAV